MKRCECCDHPLEHAIAEVIARYNAPIPPPTHRETIAFLQAALDEFRGDDVGPPSPVQFVAADDPPEEP